MKIKIREFSILSLLLTCIPLFMYFQVWKKVKSVNYIIHNLFKESIIDITELFILFFTLFIICINYEIGYDEVKGTFYSKIFLVKNSIKCEKIAYLSYCSGGGHIIVRNEKSKALIHLVKIYRKKKITELFSLIQKDYPNIVISIC